MKSNKVLVKIFMRFVLTGIFISSLAPTFLCGQDNPEGLLLTWQSDPTTTMTVDWHVKSERVSDAVIHFKQARDSVWRSQSGHRITLPIPEKNIYRVELSGLNPGTRYAFRLGGFDQTYYFETMPSDIEQTPIVFAIGGNKLDQDFEGGKMCMERVTSLAGQYKPRFLLWSGNWPDNQTEENLIWKWHEWFDAFQNGLVDEDGLVIPVVVPGGHSIPVGAARRSEITQGKNASFTSPTHSSEKQVLDFGKYLSFLYLNPRRIEGAFGNQTRWLRKMLRSRKNRPHVFPVYQARAYPASPTSSSEFSAQINQYWIPLFDRFEVPLVFEFQEKLYKRTVPLQNDQMVPSGTIYLGHGSWSADFTPPAVRDIPGYIDQMISERTIILVALHGSNRFIRTVNEFGQIVDEHPHLFNHPSFTASFSTLLPKGGITLSASLANSYGGVHRGSDPSGSGFAWFDQTSESAGLIWSVPSHTTNDYTVRFRYSHPGPEDAQLQLLINGEVIDKHFTFEAVGHATRWRRSSLVNIVLQKGLNHVEIRMLKGKTPPRIDRVEILPAVF